MGKKSTRAINREKLDQATGLIDKAAVVYDQAIEVYIVQDIVSEEVLINVMELLQMAKDLMEQSFEGI